MQNVGRVQYSGERTYFTGELEIIKPYQRLRGFAPQTPFGRLSFELIGIVELFYSTIPLYLIVLYIFNFEKFSAAFFATTAQ